jgi:hypothetical protein
MKTLLPLLALAGTVFSGAAQTNAPAPTPVAAPTQVSTPLAPAIAPEKPAADLAGSAIQSTSQSAALPVATIPLSVENLPKIEPKPPVDGIEGRHVNYTGAVPRAVKAGGFRGVLNLFNPFAKLSAAEKRRGESAADRPEPRGFVDDKELQPEGIRLISVEER